MGTEIERKFLVEGSDWKANSPRFDVCQGYLCLGRGVTVRARTCDDRGYLTVKGPGKGIARREFEYEIPYAEAREILDTMCEKPLIEKDRYLVRHGGLVWEIDEFRGANSGLVVAEVELDDPEQAVALPEWIGREVSGESRYYNASLVKYPYSEWNEQAENRHG